MRLRALAAVALLVVSGCSGLPERTAVQPGRTVDAVSNDEGIHVDPQGPVAGAEPKDVVLGFLRATVTFDEDATVARQFLAADAAQQWRPAEAVIAENQVQPTVTIAGTVATVSIAVTGALDAQGHYRDLPPGTVRTLRLTMARAQDEWRIANGLAAFGALLSRNDFARYACYPVYYATPGGEAAIEDRRWLLRGKGLVTRLAKDILDVPPAYLRGAVASGVPDGASLVGSVAVENGTAKVQLSDAANRADDQSRRLLWSRFVTTLTQVNVVNQVQLLVGDTHLVTSGLPDRPLATADVQLGQAVVRTDVAVTRLGATLTAVTTSDLGSSDAHKGSNPPPRGVGVLPRLTDHWYHVALAADAGEVAATSTDGSELGRWRGGNPIVVAPFASNLTRPTYDRLGTLWVGASARRGGEVWALDTTATGTPAPWRVACPWLAGRAVVAVAVADDAQRAAVVSTDAQGASRIDIAGVVRRAGRPVALASPLTVGATVSWVSDVTWVDSSKVAVLGHVAPKAARRVVVVPLAEPVQALAEVADARTVTAYGERALVVVTRANRVLLQAGATFAPALASREFALPGR